MRLGWILGGLSIAGVLCAALVSAVGGGGGPGVDRALPLGAWEACGSTFECTSIEVPLDYREPGGPQLEIALIRTPALDPERRIGSLLLNPGGPGASGVELVRDAYLFVDRRLRERFDLVGFDPRGVGSSSPVHCSAHFDALRVLDPTPDTLAEVAAIEEYERSVIEECIRLDARLLPFLGTVQVAQDLDRIRAALGEERVTYLGFSYGTLIGGVYAELFPQRVRALLLDGGIHPDTNWRRRAPESASALEVALERFFEYCRLEECVSSGRTEAIWDGLRAGVEEASAPLDGAASVIEFYVATATALAAGPDGWDTLDVALEDAEGGDHAALVELAGFEAATDFDSGASYGVACADDRERPSVEDVLAVDRELLDAYPRLGGLGASPCIEGWPLPAKPLPEIRGRGAPPILVVGTRYDPNTPYEWSVELANDLESGMLLTYEGDGHTASQQWHTCVDDIVATYLIDLAVPADGTSCPAE